MCVRYRLVSNEGYKPCLPGFIPFGKRNFKKAASRVLFERRFCDGSDCFCCLFAAFAVTIDEEIAQVLEVLRVDKIAIEEPNWNRRYRRYVEKIQSGSLEDVAQVLRDLHLTRADKQLSYGERRVYEMAMQLLIQELAVAQGSTLEKVREEIEQLLG